MPGGLDFNIRVEFKDGVRRVEPTSVHFCDETNAILTKMEEERHAEN